MPSRYLTTRTIARAAVVALALAAPLGLGSAVAQTSPGVAIAGDVEHPAQLSLADLRKVPPATEAVFFHTGHGGVSGSFTGAPLWSILQAAGFKTDPAIKSEPLRRYLVVKAGDGYLAVVALAELDPEFGGQQAILAYEQGGKPLDDKAGPIRLIMPGDKHGGRDVMNVIAIELRTAAP
jgi:DMSO/TMAO reductase YedYZ molybdopterin-dependent catalytic subunit